MGLVVLDLVLSDVIMYHLMRHDIDEGLLVEVEVVRKTNALILQSLPFPSFLLIFLLCFAIIKPRHHFKRMDDVKVWIRQFIIEELLLAVPINSWHAVQICYHSCYFSNL